ncbi:serine/threonine-protein kinase M1 [Entomophthora muscae]|uniref:Serine/threonine-protein kinase M1 n=1 Tax=Entomophthora muscae TaxID=34485 RepID=A0ACC2S060_9FUNG|nr:serine/threonine-protein kinase M1 [Entomophthora muscae]
MMDLFSFLNYMFCQDSEACRQQLNTQTFSVVPLDNQYGLIEWVENHEVLKSCIMKTYLSHSIEGLPEKQLQSLMTCQSNLTREQRIHIFENQVLSAFPPILSKWFSSHFPHPMQWFAARAAFAKALAVMSIVGFVIGLGDRHGENILLNKDTGSVLHVDFSSLFEASTRLQIPERVPFRLT